MLAVAFLIQAGVLGERSYRYWKTANHHKRLGTLNHQAEQKALRQIDQSRTMFGLPPRTINRSYDESAVASRTRQWCLMIDPIGNPRQPLVGEAELRAFREASVVIEEDQAAGNEAWAVYHGRLHEKYRRAIWEPWRRMTPDPKGPDGWMTLFQ